MGEYTKMKFTYLRHVLAESNQRGNIGVHIYDPEILRGKKDEEYGHLGQSLCRAHLLPALKDRRFTHIAVSPSARAISTMIQSLPIDILTTAMITVMPDLLEQTHWGSDRPRSVRGMQRLMKKELIDIGHLDSKPLQVNFLLLLQPGRSLKSILEQFEQNAPSVLDVQEDLAQRETLTEPWHTKTGQYAPESLKDRCLDTGSGIRVWANMAHTYKKGPIDLLVVGHGGIVNYFVEEVGDIDPSNGRLSAWQPGEMRDYSVTESGLFKETAESREARLGSSAPPYIIEAEDAKRTTLYEHVIKLQDAERIRCEQISGKNGFEPLYKAASKSISDRVPGTDDYNECLQEPAQIEPGGNLKLLYYSARQPGSKIVILVAPGGRLEDIPPEALSKDGEGGARLGGRHNADVYVISKYTCASNTRPPVGEKATEDFQTALEYVRNQHPNHTIITWGWSAGAWLVTRAKHDVMVALTICSYGTLSLEKAIRHQPTCENIFGEKATDESITDWDKANPPAPPKGLLYMIHGNNDTKVPVENTLKFAELMHARGVPLKVECNPEGDHGDLRMEDHHQLNESLLEAQKEILFSIKPLNFEDIRRRVQRGDYVLFQNY